MTNKLETKLARKIKDSVITKYGGKLRNMHGGIYQEVGIPDLVGVIQGKHIEMEIKTPGNRLGATATQVKQIQDINSNGGYATIITSVEEAFEFLDSIGIKPLER